MFIRGNFSSSGTPVVSGRKKNYPGNKLPGYPKGTHSSPIDGCNTSVLSDVLLGGGQENHSPYLIVSSLTD